MGKTATSSQEEQPPKQILYVLEGGYNPGQYRIATFLSDPDPSDIAQRADLQVQVTSGDFPGEDTVVQRSKVPHNEQQRVPGTWHWA